MFVEVGGNVALFAARIEQHYRTKKMPSAVSVARAIFGVTAPSVAVSSSSRAQQLKNPVAAAATASSIGTAVDADDASVDNSSNKRRRRGKRSD
jgi:hypothetical protein